MPTSVINKGIVAWTKSVEASVSEELIRENLSTAVCGHGDIVLIKIH
jgi:hypothetical protein